MNPRHYRDLWWQLQGQAAEGARLTALARQVGFSFLDHCRYGDHYEPDYIELLCEMATGDASEARAAGAAALFGVVIEELCDDYEDFQFETYARVMTQMLTYCRTRDGGQPLHNQLLRFGLRRPKDILQRVCRLQKGRVKTPLPPAVDRIIILSRVTIGADVAIVSVIIQRLRRRYPQAEIVLVGSEKLAEVVAGLEGVRVCPLAYARRGGLQERLAVWHDVLSLIERETPTGGPDRLLIVDPDSRLSQLGLLPVNPVGHYLYFNSHHAPAAMRGISMAELTSRWLDRWLGEEAFCYPCVWPAQNAMRQARELKSLLTAQGCRQLLAVNFGVGGNHRKRLGLDFEKTLIRRLLETPATVVALDRGFGEEEVSATNQILAAVRGLGCPAATVRFGSWSEAAFARGVLGIDSSIGQMAALIGRSEEFIGYDSACQHIAAALKIPTITVFAGTNNPRFIRRWSACGDTRCRIVHVNTLMDLTGTDLEGVVDRVLQERLPDSPQSL